MQKIGVYLSSKSDVPASVLDLMKQKPTVLPAWDPLFAEDK